MTDQRADPNRFPSFFVTLHRQLFSDLARRLGVDESVLDYNYQRLLRCIDIMTNERIQHRFHRPLTVNHEHLPISEYPVALEFYLQIDGK